MAQRLGRVTGENNEWQVVEAAGSLYFEADRPRTVKMDVRAQEPVCIFLDVDDEADAEFLCVVDGYDNIEFIVDGPFSLTCDKLMFVRTDDSTYVHAPNADEEIFTKMHDRRPIAPEIMAMQRLVHKNMEQMRSQMLRDVEGMKRSTERELKRRSDAMAQAEKEAAAGGAGSPPVGEPAEAES